MRVRVWLRVRCSERDLLRVAPCAVGELVANPNPNPNPNPYPYPTPDPNLRVAPCALGQLVEAVEHRKAQRGLSLQHRLPRPGRLAPAAAAAAAAAV